MPPSAPARKGSSALSFWAEWGLCRRCPRVSVRTPQKLRVDCKKLLDPPSGALSRRRQAPPSWRSGSLPAVRDLLSRHIQDDFVPVDTVATADLYWVTPEMTNVALQAASALPAWTPGLAVPAQSGLLLWDHTGTPDVPVYAVPERPGIYGQPTQPQLPVAGVAWTVMDLEVRGVALVRTAGLPEPFADQLISRFPVVIPACTLPLMRARSVTDPSSYQPSVRPLMSFVATTWLLMGQPTLVQTAPSRRSSSQGPGQSLGGPSSDVSIVELRRVQHSQSHPDDDGADAAADQSRYRHRWLVSSYWRQQRVGKGGSQRRPVYVAAHVRARKALPYWTPSGSASGAGN